MESKDTHGFLDSAVTTVDLLLCPDVENQPTDFTSCCMCLSHVLYSQNTILSKTVFVIWKCSSFHRFRISYWITCRYGTETGAQTNRSAFFGHFYFIFILLSAQTVVFGTGSHHGSWPAASETMRCVSLRECFAICLSRWDLALLCVAPGNEKQEKCFHRTCAPNLQPGHPCWTVMRAQIRPQPAGLWQKSYLRNKKGEREKKRP